METKREYYLNGKLKSECQYKNNQLHGPSIEWWENGNKRWEAQYQNGQLEGIAIGWWRNGRKYWKTELKNGKSHGKYIEWSENGKLRHEQYYLYGEPTTEEEYRKHQLIEKLVGI